MVDSPRFASWKIGTLTASLIAKMNWFIIELGQYKSKVIVYSQLVWLIYNNLSTSDTEITKVRSAALSWSGPPPSATPSPNEMSQRKVWATNKCFSNQTCGSVGTPTSVSSLHEYSMRKHFPTRSSDLLLIKCPSSWVSPISNKRRFAQTARNTETWH